MAERTLTAAHLEQIVSHAYSELEASKARGSEVSAVDVIRWFHRQFPGDAAGPEATAPGPTLLLKSGESYALGITELPHSDLSLLNEPRVTVWKLADGKDLVVHGDNIAAVVGLRCILESDEVESDNGGDQDDED